MTSKRFSAALLALICAFALVATAGQAADEAAAPKAKKGKKGQRAPLNTLSEAEKAAGWQLLFNGTDLAGWSGLGRTAVPQAFKVADGILHKDPNAPNEGDLMTQKTYENFELTFEWKLAKGSNNGIKYNVSEELSVGPTKKGPAVSAGPSEKGHAALGFEYQVLDDPNHSDGKLASHQCGALYFLVAPDPAKKKVKPIGQWNRSKIVFDGNHIEHWLNGEKIVTADLGTPEMDAAVAASKWNKIKGFADKRAGHIVITDHHDEAWYRNLKIRELPRK